ncbi:MAG: hypothetical protein ACFFG0_47215, partial [Candidatus Thorarchaeota archaeon]
MPIQFTISVQKSGVFSLKCDEILKMCAMFPDFIEEAIIEVLPFRQIFSRYIYDAIHLHGGVQSPYRCPNSFSEPDDGKVGLYQDCNAFDLYYSIQCIPQVIC